ncbi:hypothetical protein GW17_00054843 [Ensete ventricosum]|nr:hypothetical protein GW17_00054843 [Ensete ventricosum]
MGIIIHNRIYVCIGVSSCHVIVDLVIIGFVMISCHSIVGLAPPPLRAMSLPAGYLPARDRLQVAGSNPCCVAAGDCSRSPSSDCPYGLAATDRPFAGGQVMAGHPCKGLGHGQPPMHVDNKQVVAPRP